MCHFQNGQVTLVRELEGTILPRPLCQKLTESLRRQQQAAAREEVSAAAPPGTPIKDFSLSQLKLPFVNQAFVGYKGKKKDIVLIVRHIDEFGQYRLLYNSFESKQATRITSVSAIPHETHYYSMIWLTDPFFGKDLGGRAVEV